MKIHFRLSDERLITPTGISLVGQLLAASNFIRIINRLPMEKKRSQPQIPTGDILLCYIALLCQAKTCFDAYRELEAGREFYKLSLGLKKGIASPETAYQRMDPQMQGVHNKKGLQLPNSKSTVNRMLFGYTVTRFRYRCINS